MKTIYRAAYLDLCTCLNHGHIVCADGTKSEEVLSKEGAIFEQQKLAFEEKISSFEVPELLRQIKASPLLSTDQEAAKAGLEENLSILNRFFHAIFYFGR